jgi:protein TonB
VRGVSAAASRTARPTFLGALATSSAAHAALLGLALLSPSLPAGVRASRPATGGVSTEARIVRLRPLPDFERRRADAPVELPEDGDLDVEPSDPVERSPLPTTPEEPHEPAPIAAAPTWGDLTRELLPPDPARSTMAGAEAVAGAGAAPDVARATATIPAAEAAVAPAVLLEAPEPAYPVLSRRAGEEGTVLCRLHVDALGAVSRVEVVTSSGFPRLDAAAVRALERWRFRPRTRGGQGVPSEILHPVSFVLREGAAR